MVTFAYFCGNIIIILQTMDKKRKTVRETETAVRKIKTKLAVSVDRYVKNRYNTLYCRQFTMVKHYRITLKFVGRVT